MRCALPRPEGQDGHTSVVSAVMMACVEGSGARRTPTGSHLSAVMEGFRAEGEREGLHGRACGCDDSQGRNHLLCHHTLFNPVILMRCLLFPFLDLGVG